MKNNNQDWETLLKFLDDNDLIESNFIDDDLSKYKFDHQSQFYNYYKDYKKLISIDSLLKSKAYYQQKYLIIAKHLVEMDDYYLSFEKNNFKYSENSAGTSFLSKSISTNKSKTKSNRNKSTGSQIKTDLNEFKLGYTKTLLEIFENEK